ncbi:MAG: ergothioneine biosynthesis protein EgtB [Planctomycetota bacterium]
MQGLPDQSTVNDTISVADAFVAARSLSAELAAPLSEEDCCVQSQACCSPVKWHLGHTTWFFERFLVNDVLKLDPYDDRFEFLFNSYYNAIGSRQPRAQRGLLTRPGLGEIMAYRSVVDEHIERALRRGDLEQEHVELVQLGLDHERQHQELLLTDVKHLFWCSPFNVEYLAEPLKAAVESAANWCKFDGGLHTQGVDFAGPGGGFDNEGPEHRVFLEPFELTDRLVTNGEFLAFVADGGYSTPGHWLDLAWTHVAEHDLAHPLYWRQTESGWQEFTLRGWTDLDPAAPLVHVSMFEADAFAKWSGARLPTEFELEVAHDHSDGRGALLEDRVFHPKPASPDRTGIAQLMGDAWEWTSSAYGPYPGYAPPGGAIGEYNGKFMCNQYVLRGASCVTPTAHVRKTYRNFYQPDVRWIFAGTRLARSI